MIIGRPGSGKTEFSIKLGKLTDRPIIHLDSLYWKPDWVKAYTSEEFRNKVSELAADDEWIIDGDFRSSIGVRLERADTVVFFDFPVWVALLGAYRRWIFGGSNRIDKHPGMRERVSLSLLNAIIFYNSKRIYDLISKSRAKHIFILKNRSDAEKALDKIAAT